MGNPPRHTTEELVVRISITSEPATPFRFGVVVFGALNEAIAPDAFATSFGDTRISRDAVISHRETATEGHEEFTIFLDEMPSKAKTLFIVCFTPEGSKQTDDVRLALSARTVDNQGESPEHPFFSAPLTVSGQQITTAEDSLTVIGAILRASDHAWTFDPSVVWTSNRTSFNEKFGVNLPA